MTANVAGGNYHMPNPNMWQPYTSPTSPELRERAVREGAAMVARLDGLRNFAGAAFAAPLEDAWQPLRQTLSDMSDALFFTEQRRDEVEKLVNGMHAALKIPPRPAWDTSRRESNPVKDVEDMVARCEVAELSLSNARAVNAKLQDRATVEWSNGQDARVAVLEEGLRQLVRDGQVTRAQSARIRRAGRDKLNEVAGITVSAS